MLIILLSCLLTWYKPKIINPNQPCNQPNSSNHLHIGPYLGSIASFWVWSITRRKTSGISSGCQRLFSKGCHSQQLHSSALKHSCCVQSLGSLCVRNIVTPSQSEGKQILPTRFATFYIQREFWPVICTCILASGTAATCLWDVWRFHSTWVQHTLHVTGGKN